MDVLVTGATGFLGKHLIYFLIRQKNVNVWALSKHESQVHGVHSNAVDLNDFHDLVSWSIGKPIFDTVFHLAAVVPKSFDSKEAEQSLQQNISMTQNLLSVLSHEGSRFVYISSSSVYGNNTSQTPITEDTDPQPDNLYSLGKYTGEHLCRISNLRKGVGYVALRISAPYGPDQLGRTVLKIFLQAANESRNITLYGSGNRTQDFTHVSDVIQAMWLAHEKKNISGIFNVASGQSVTMSELAETILNVVPGTKSKITYSEQSDAQDTYRGVFSIEKAKRLLGYTPQILLSQGLQTCLTSISNKE